MDEEECCVIGLCCEPTKAQSTFADQLQAAVHLNKHDAEAVAAFVIGHYDLAPHGLFKPLMDRIAEEAREYPYE